MLKRISKVTIICALGCGLITLIIESVIQKQFSYYFSLALLIGVATGLFNLFLTDHAIEKVQYNLVKNPKAYFPSINLIKLLIYAACFVFVAKFLNPYAVFTCFFGVMLNKIVIYILYLLVDKIKDKKRTVDALPIKQDIKDKLKANGFEMVSQITEVNREKLQEFLTVQETNEVIRALKEFELFIKGELEAIIEDDDDALV